MVPTSGHKSIGLITDEVPTSAEENGYRKGMCDYLAWLDGRTTRTQHRLPTPFLATNWATGLVSSLLTLASSASGDAYIDLGLTVGEQLDSFTLAMLGNGTVDGSITIQKHFSGSSGTAPATVATLTLTNVAASWADQVMNMIAKSSTTSGGVTVTVANNGGGNAQYTRSAGSFLTDGFFIGQVVSWAGFVNSGNNAASATISSLSATVMVTSNTSFVAETGPANTTLCAGITAIVDGTFNLVAKLSANATGLSARSMRITSDVPA